MLMFMSIFWQWTKNTQQLIKRIYPGLLCWQHICSKSPDHISWHMPQVQFFLILLWAWKLSSSLSPDFIEVCILQLLINSSRSSLLLNTGSAPYMSPSLSWSLSDEAISSCISYYKFYPYALCWCYPLKWFMLTHIVLLLLTTTEPIEFPTLRIMTLIGGDMKLCVTWGSCSCWWSSPLATSSRLIAGRSQIISDSTQIIKCGRIQIICPYILHIYMLK